MGPCRWRGSRGGRVPSATSGRARLGAPTRIPHAGSPLGWRGLPRLRTEPDREGGEPSRRRRHPRRPPAPARPTGGTTQMDWKLELVNVPVADVDRAKAFYANKVGFNVDHDHTVNQQIRFVQLTPPGSACSIALTTGVPAAAPGSLQGMQVVVQDADAARAELAGRGVEEELAAGPGGRGQRPDQA